MLIASNLRGLPRIKPMLLERFPCAFSHPDWLFEVKHDGFRAMAYLETSQLRLISRRDHEYRSFPTLCHSIASALKVKDAILDGEIVSIDQHGVAQFKQLMYRRYEPRFYAFDILWVNGEDLRELPLLERKSILRKVIPTDCPSLLYVDHLEERGEGLFDICCSLDLEGIVAKYKHGKYVSGPETTWAKIKNPHYSQIVDRDEMFGKKAA